MYLGPQFQSMVHGVVHGPEVRQNMMLRSILWSKVTYLVVTGKERGEEGMREKGKGKEGRGKGGRRRDEREKREKGGRREKRKDTISSSCAHLQ